MDIKTQSGVRRLSALAAAALATLALTGCDGVPDSAQILIPKPAEFVPALIAFLIIWFVLAKFAWPMIVKTLDDRENKIKGDLDAAEHAKAEAEQEKKDYAAQLADAHTQADQIVAEAKKEAEQERSQMLARAQKEAAATVAKSRDALETERRKAMIELSSSVVDLSVEITGKIIGDELTEDQQRKLAEKYLNEVGKPDEH